MIEEDRPGEGALVLITAPPGTGKSTVLPHVITRARSRAVVADIDEVLEDGSLLGVKIADPTAAPIWPAYDRLWYRITNVVTRAGFNMVLFTQVPDRLPWPAMPRVKGVVGWEIDDDVRAARLRGRGESGATIADSRSDSAMLRRLLPPASIIRSNEDETPEGCADALWAAVKTHLSRP